ncbi:hypothetical protein ACXO7G_09515, partial [Lactobacillus delbrueckii subsp. bulgaricus]
ANGFKTSLCICLVDMPKVETTNLFELLELDDEHAVEIIAEPATKTLAAIKPIFFLLNILYPLLKTSVYFILTTNVNVPLAKKE